MEGERVERLAAWASPQESVLLELPPEIKGTPAVATVELLDWHRRLLAPAGGLDNDSATDTPGGAYHATRKIVQHLLAADMLVAVYVAPKGARAASAGTFILAAANFAVMAPGTNIGAASPVSATGEDIRGSLQQKVTNDAAALMRSIAQERGRNGDKLEVTVRNAASFSASEAVDAHIVDFIAKDTEDLLTQLNGRTAQTAAGRVIMNLASASKRTLKMTLRERFVALVATPELVSILYTVGMIAIFIELFHPGLVAPAVIGALCLVLAFVALGSRRSTGRGWCC